MGYSFPDTPWLDILRLDTPWLDTFNMVSPQGCISPQVNYPLRQHISSGTIFVLVTNFFQHVVFPQLQSVQAVSSPLDWLLLTTVGSWRECLHPLLVRAGAQLNLFFVRSPFISCDPVLSTHPYRVWKARVDKAAGAGGGGWGWLHAPLVLILVVYGKPDLKTHNTICYWCKTWIILEYWRTKSKCIYLSNID